MKMFPRVTLDYKNSQISYLRFGNGPRPVLCFHGYGEEADSFAFLEKYLGQEFTFYSIDLPYHGQTKWNEGLNVKTVDLSTIVNEILNAAPGTHPRKPFLMGFSLGGRVALSLYQNHPPSFEKLVLLAPDGLKVNFWYWLSTQTWPGNRLFGFTMKHPGWFFSFLKLLNKLGMVNASIFKFINYYIGDQKVRKDLYDRWTGLRKLKPDIAAIKSEIEKQGTTVHLIYGVHDRIMLPSIGERFRRGIEKNCSISIIHSGHQVLHEKHIRELLPAFNPSVPNS
jgi:pimeloyl-ACP methyl ester carboxylesterase